jgi:hypothetical protein
MEFAELSTVTNESIQLSIFRLRSIASHLKTLLMGTIIILEINSLAFHAQWNVGLDASSTSGFSLTTFFGKVGRIPMNDQNSNTPRRIAF